MTLSIAMTGTVATGRRLLVMAPKTAESPAGAADEEARLSCEAFFAFRLEDFP
jgi:hypothetical protein